MVDLIDFIANLILIAGLVYLTSINRSKLNSAVIGSLILLTAPQFQVLDNKYEQWSFGTHSFVPGPSNPEHGRLQRFYFCVRSLCLAGAGRWAVPGAKYKSSKCIVGLDLNPLSTAPAPDC